jgi:chromosome segregation ATPase
VSQTLSRYIIKKEIESIKESMKTDSAKLTQLRTNISFLENELMRIRLEIELKQDAENLIGEKLNHLKEKQEYINNNYSTKNKRIHKLELDFANPNRDRSGE